ncbi:hypothetical protein N474_14650 [Pseudoalteromonas luteoviolacea CPMOR-2]|uniref:hypothetical protein n=1 Tax=Pseudoalteromonas luteoviolacea TaxID=43657 RepID=UPI0007B099D0|nr:hypothetical protein [Pseudoalteromonas luteoviolacea]KZN55624.1 hypothetical protein N474_14650 [Pseudoalteromonas luteoviolacea CPMOR-2]
MKFKASVVVFSLFTLAGCATTSLSEQAFGTKLPKYENTEEQKIATIEFSADKKYETKKGVPFSGEPVVCTPSGLKSAFGENERSTKIQVPANEPIIVTSIIKWYNSGWEKSCWPFVSFVPELGSNYVLVNERIGGKGISALWTGVAFQSCKVSVYKLVNNKPVKIEAKKVNPSHCGS